jgi:hypothetical protein
VSNANLTVRNAGRERLDRRRDRDAFVKDALGRVIDEQFQIEDVYTFFPGDVGAYASAVVVTKRLTDVHDRFTVHMLVRRDDRVDDDGVPVDLWYLTNGFYCEHVHQVVPELERRGAL